ncbi:MAG: hypothetical protein KDL87_04575 [Verrucomicrobiae bacterium]|nr:hypothetical protein [Verrucomicrobiae bacterium]
MNTPHRLLKPLAAVLCCGALLAFVARADDAGTLKAGALTFKFAKPWENVSSGRPMRAGELKYDHTEEGLEDVECVLYYFGPGQGGGIDANVERWIGQFEADPKVERETAELKGHKIHYLYATGTYLDAGMGGPFSGAPKTPKPNSMMLGAIVESEEGAVFLKLVGPEKSVAAVKDAFKKLASSPFED